MSRLFRQLWLSLSLSLVAASSDAAEKSGGCLSIQPATAFDGSGYLHYATLRNDCRGAVRCSLWTDVDPPPQVVEVQPGQSAEVTFRRGSPAAEFRAFARCQFR
jgi:hypothetical protein